MFKAEVTVDFWFSDNDADGPVKQSRFTILAPTLSALTDAVARVVLNQARLSEVADVRIDCKEE